MRAGIGRVAHLRQFDIEVRVALPDVAQRLQDHPAVAIATFLKPHTRIIHDYTRMHMYTASQYSSNLPGIPSGDLLTLVANKTAWHKVGQQIISFFLAICDRIRHAVERRHSLL